MMRQLQQIAFKILPVSWLRNRLVQLANIQSFSENKKKIIIDVSSIAQSDAKTGIQRVIRNLYRQLLLNPPDGYQICPVMATRRRFYQYIPTDFLQMPSPAIVDNTPIQIHSGDIFLGLDLSAHLTHHHLPELWAWKRQGLHMTFVIYDLLPVLQPQWFTPRASRNFHQWLHVLALLADNTFAISRSVQGDFYSWMLDKYKLNESNLPCSPIQLGAELNSEDDASDCTENHLPMYLVDQKYVLIVGTLEPRKGHDDLLNAFDQLWSNGEQTNLVIVGKQGWKVESLVDRLRGHLELGKRLHWFNDANDEILRALYRFSRGVILASKGEGCGLPLIEAAFFNKPVLARDIPVFKEIAGSSDHSQH